MSGKADHRGFGHIRKLPSGRWQASYLGPDLKRHTASTTFDDKDTAVVWLTRERVLLESDEWLPPKERRERQRRDSFGAYAEAWLTQRKVAGKPLKPRTRAHYRQLLDRALLPVLGTVPVRSITVEAVRTWHAGLNPTAATWNAHAYSLLASILATAVDDGLLPRNPCRIKGAGRTRRESQTQIATLDELAAIIEKVPERFRLMVLFASWCAMRFGELIELRRSDVDVKNSVIHIRRALSWADGQAVIGPPKSNAGIRTVVIPPHLMPAVKAHLRAMPMTGRHALLFPSAVDPTRPMRQSTLQRAFYPAREAAGRPDLRFHDLRHTGATLAAQTGATLAELMHRLGHSTPAAALTYQHAAADRDRAIAAAMSASATRHAEA